MYPKNICPCLLQTSFIAARRCYQRSNPNTLGYTANHLFTSPPAFSRHVRRHDRNRLPPYPLGPCRGNCSSIHSRLLPTKPPVTTRHHIPLLRPCLNPHRALGKPGATRAEADVSRCQPDRLRIPPKCLAGSPDAAPSSTTVRPTRSSPPFWRAHYM